MLKIWMRAHEYNMEAAYHLCLIRYLVVDPKMIIYTQVWGGGVLSTGVVHTEKSAVLSMGPGNGILSCAVW